MDFLLDFLEVDFKSFCMDFHDFLNLLDFLTYLVAWLLMMFLLQNLSEINNNLLLRRRHCHRCEMDRLEMILHVLMFLLVSICAQPEVAPTPTTTCCDAWIVDVCFNVNDALPRPLQLQKLLDMLEVFPTPALLTANTTQSHGLAPTLSVGDEPAELAVKFVLDLWLAQRDSDRPQHLAMDFRPRALVMDFMLRRLDLACSDQCESLLSRCSFR
jgi:hypothetical protein